VHASSPIRWDQAWHVIKRAVARGLSDGRRRDRPHRCRGEGMPQTSSKHDEAWWPSVTSIMARSTSSRQDGSEPVFW